MSDHLVVVVSGRPAPQGSKRHVGNGRMVESSQAVGPWRDAVRMTAAAALVGSGWVAGSRPLTLEVVFTMPRPRAHYRGGRHADEVRADAPRHPTKRPDLDKLLRSTLDALTDAGAVDDDANVVRILALKTYPLNDLDALDTPGAVITLRPCDDWRL